jgi:ankyrin repeat protein
MKAMQLHLTRVNLAMRLLALFLALISVASGNRGYPQKPASSAQQSTTSVRSPCELSTGLVHAPLMVAIWQGDLKTVQNLVTSRTTLNAFFRMEGQDSSDEILTTPLEYAIHAKNASRHCSHSDEMIEFLLGRNADPNFYAPRSISPLQMAVAFGDVSSVRILLRHKARVEDQNPSGETALLMAAQRANGAAVIKELVAAGANIHAVNDFGDNAVMLAAWKHHLDTVKLLVGLGVDACAKNFEGETAIDQANSYLDGDPAKLEIISFLQAKCGG